MKKKALVMFLLVTITFSIDNVISAQQSKWVKQKGNSPTESLTIAEKEDTSVWLVCDNQLNIVFKTKFKKDTAFFYVVSSDKGQVFSTLHTKEGALFAKCNLVSKDKIHLTYFDKSFIRTVNSVYPNAFSSEMCRAAIKKKSIEEMLKNRQALTNKQIDNGGGNIPTMAQAMSATKRLSTDMMNGKAAMGWKENQQIIKSCLYCLYIKSLDSISDADVWNYYDAFDPLPEDLNEFQQQKYLVSGKEKLNSIKNDTLVMAKDRTYITTASLGQYNFEKGGFTFPASKRGDDGLYPRSKDEDGRILDRGTHFDLIHPCLYISFENLELDKQLLMPVDAAKAEELINKYPRGSERTVYCIYTFDYADNHSYRGDYNGHKSVSFIQNAIVKSIDFYIDKECTQKIAFVAL